MLKRDIHIALIGNPNSGKSSLFNALTGLNQKVGNFPGVTVDKKSGSTKLAPDINATIIDLPGTYSLYPKRSDEWVTYKVLLNQDPSVRADMVILLVDASNLKKNVEWRARQLHHAPPRDFIPNLNLASGAIQDVRRLFPEISDYTAIHYLITHEHFHLTPTLQTGVEQIESAHQFNHTRTQAEEILQRYSRIRTIMKHTVSEPDPLEKTLFTERLDKLFLDRTWGYVILLVVLFLLFQSVFWLAQFPMDAIDWSFSHMNGWLGTVLPEGWWSNLLVNGLLAGLSGILVFVPQIAILFGLITLLEDTGYMARISFLSDKLMRKVGLNGKSVMPMISGFACAVPAIMSARNIENRKERLLTILITPLMSCSARLPVYTILIALVIPRKDVLGIFGLQGLVMMGLYMLGLLMAMVVSYVAK